jgi:hypothetical protein
MLPVPQLYDNGSSSSSVQQQQQQQQQQQSAQPPLPPVFEHPQRFRMMPMRSLKEYMEINLGNLIGSGTYGEVRCHTITCELAVVLTHACIPE